MREPAVLMVIGSDFVAARHRALLDRAPHLRVVTDLQQCDSADVDAIFAFKLQPGVVPELPNLKLLASVGAGVDGLLSAGDIPMGVAVTRVVDTALGQSMSQYVSYQVVRQFRSFGRYERQALAQVWDRHAIPDASTHTVGLMGVGEVGRVVALALNAQGFRVTGWSRSGQASEGVQRMYRGDAELARFISDVDTLVCLLPFTPQTRGMLDYTLLSQLKPGSCIVNAARGGIVVEQDLVKLLDDGHLSAAAFDVFETEPLPTSAQLWRHPKVSVTPHIAAQPSVKTAVDQFITNLARVRAGRAPLYAVDRAAGY